MTDVPIPMLLTCPNCGARHIDHGEFATKPHRTHACQECGLCWRPAVVTTVGVQFLPGFKDEAAAARGCQLPPSGWSCSRGAGHDGPCAAWPIRTGEGRSWATDARARVKAALSVAEVEDERDAACEMFWRPVERTEAYLDGWNREIEKRENEFEAALAACDQLRDRAELAEAEAAELRAVLAGLVGRELRCGKTKGGVCLQAATKYVGKTPYYTCDEHAVDGAQDRSTAEFVRRAAALLKGGAT